MTKQNDPTLEFLAAIGEKIRYYRKKKGHSLESLGYAIGLDKGNMHHIESGKNITLVTLLKLGLFLDVHPSKLLSADVGMTLEEVEKFIRKKKTTRGKAKKTTRKK